MPEDKDERDRDIIARLITAGIPREAINKAVAAGISLALLDAAMNGSYPEGDVKSASAYWRETATRWRKDFGADQELVDYLAQVWDVMYRAAIDPQRPTNPPGSTIKTLDDAMKAFGDLDEWQTAGATETCVTLTDVVAVIRKPAKQTILNRMTRCRRQGEPVPTPIKTGGTSKDTYPYAELRRWLITQFPDFRLEQFFPEQFGDFAKVFREVSTK